MARAGPEGKQQDLQPGADDYMTKPSFRRKKMVLRVGNILQCANSGRFRLMVRQGALVLDKSTLHAGLWGEPLDPTIAESNCPPISWSASARCGTATSCRKSSSVTLMPRNPGLWTPISNACAKSRALCRLHCHGTRGGVCFLSLARSRGCGGGGITW